MVGSKLGALVLQTSWREAMATIYQVLAAAPRICTMFAIMCSAGKCLVLGLENRRECQMKVLELWVLVVAVLWKKTDSKVWCPFLIY